MEERMKMICTGGPYSDCTASYDVKLNKKFTVQEFVEMVLEEKPGEWGTVKVCKNLERIHENALDVCDYAHGKIKKYFSPIEMRERKIEKVIAHGGWTNMDYFIKAEQPETLEEQQQAIKEAALAARAEVIDEERAPETLEEIKRQVENAYTDLKGCRLYKEEKYFKHGIDMMYDNVIDIINAKQAQNN